jgi:hypothetical protein
MQEQVDRVYRLAYRLAYPIARRWWRLYGRHHGVSIAVWLGAKITTKQRFASFVKGQCDPRSSPSYLPASRTPFVGSAADHPLNLCHQLIQIERLGHDFHAVLHAAVANGCVLGIAG